MEEKEENVVEETTQEQVEQTQEENKPEIDLTKFKSKDDDSVVKVDLSKPPTPKENEEIKDDAVDDGGVVELTENATTSQEQEKVQSETETQEDPVLQEITEEAEEVADIVEEAITESIETGKELPENIQKLMDFMEDTGGDLEDYIKLNQDYNKLDESSLLKEYYKQTKTHLNDEEINFLMEDQFSYDEDIDDERDIKRKKLALKEQVANAKTQLEENKSKYYEEIKAGSKLTSEQQKAIDFFNRYDKESKGTQKIAKKNTEIFEQKTNNLFNDKFKGFEYDIGEKKFRFNVKDVGGTKKSQSDLNGFMSKFVNKDLSLNDAKGYHKSLFTAMNADKIANHFYEQGKADALKNSVAKSKNINMDPRQQHSGVVEAGGIKVKVLGENSNDFKFKIKNK